MSRLEKSLASELSFHSQDALAAYICRLEGGLKPGRTIKPPASATQVPASRHLGGNIGSSQDQVQPASGAFLTSAQSLRQVPGLPVPDIEFQSLANPQPKSATQLSGSTHSHMRSGAAAKEASPVTPGALMAASHQHEAGHDESCLPTSEPAPACGSLPSLSAATPVTVGQPASAVGLKVAQRAASPGCHQQQVDMPADSLQTFRVPPPGTMGPMPKLTDGKGPSCNPHSAEELLAGPADVGELPLSGNTEVGSRLEASQGGIDTQLMCQGAVGASGADQRGEPIVCQPPAELEDIQPTVVPLADESTEPLQKVPIGCCSFSAGAADEAGEANTAEAAPMSGTPDGMPGSVSIHANQAEARVAAAASEASYARYGRCSAASTTPAALPLPTITNDSSESSAVAGTLAPMRQSSIGTAMAADTAAAEMQQAERKLESSGEDAPAAASGCNPDLEPRTTVNASDTQQEAMHLQKDAAHGAAKEAAVLLRDPARELATTAAAATAAESSERAAAGPFPWPLYLIGTRDCFTNHLVPLSEQVKLAADVLLMRTDQ